MRKKALLVSVSLTLLIGLMGTAVVVAALSPDANSPRGLARPSSQQARPMTLAEAREIIEAYAQQWQMGAKVVRLTSMDHPKDSPSAGRDGRRRAWQAVLLGTNPPGAQRWVTLVDGAIVEEADQPPAADMMPLSGGPTLDSPEALRLALAAKPDFAPADGKGKGFHFALERSPEGLLVITVRGARGSMPAIVSLDATTGQVLAARRLTFEYGGILYSSDAGQTWHAGDLVGKMVTAIAADPLVEDQAYAVIPQDNRIAVYQTRDGGKTWALRSILPEAAGDWPYSLLAVHASRTPFLVVGTASGLWVSARDGDWSRISDLPEGPKQWLAAVRSEKGYRIFVSITAGEHQGLYASSDLLTWKKLADSVYRLSESFDRKWVLATDEQRAGPDLLLSIAGKAAIEMPEPVLHAAGDFTGLAPMILHSPLSGVNRWFRQEAKRTLTVPVASLAAAPDFPTSGVAIAGGFRTGVYRTTDGGQTWHQVLVNPSGILPGSGEVIGVAFLSPTTVIAVNGGDRTWRDF